MSASAPIPSGGGLPAATVTASGASAAATGGSAAATGGSAAASGGSIANVLNLPRGDVTVRMETRTDEHGSVVDVVTQLPPPVRRPPGPPPARPVAVFGRAAQLNRLTDAISGSAPIVVAGAAGAGKSTVIAAAANGAEAAAVSDGIVVIRSTADGEQRGPDWIAQEIYSAIWDTGEERRYQTALTARAELAGVRPLVLVDGPSLGLEDLRAVADIVPGSPLVIASEQLPVGGPLRFVPLPPLARADSVRLLADLAGSDLTAAPGLDRAAELLDDWPGALATVGGVIGAGRITLGSALELMEAASSGDRTPPARGYVRALAVLDQALSPDERTVLEAIAGFAGAPVRDDIASRVAGQASTAAADSLVASTVARHNSPQLTIDEGLIEALRLDPERATAAQAADVVARNPAWIAAGEDGLAVADLPVALAALEAAWKQGNWPSVRALVRAIDPVVGSRGLWDVWADVLAKARGAAIRSDSKADVGWADHQLGTRALASGDLETAGEILQEAVDIRDGLGLNEAAERTRHNLETLRVLLAPPIPPTPPPSTAGRPWLGMFVAAIAIVGILVFGPRIVEAVLSPTAGQTASPQTRQPTDSPTQAPTQATEAPTVAPTQAPTDSPTEPAIPLDATVALVSDPRVARDGTWNGLVEVTPLNGTPPYTFSVAGKESTSEGAMRFPVSGVRCDPARVDGSVTSADPSFLPFDFDEEFPPPGCRDYDAPPPPDLLRPAADSDLELDCSKTRVPFAWSATDGAVAWLFEVQRMAGGVWVEERTERLTARRYSDSLPCGDHQWHVAAVSARNWESEYSAWRGFTTSSPTPVTPP